MSRVKTLLIAAILVVGILFPTTTALASPGTTVSITDATLPAETSGSVELSITATEPVSCIDVDITYNPAVVEVTEVTDASGSDFYGLVSNIESGHTHLVAWVGSPTGLPAGTIKVADITLTRKIDGVSELALNVITLKGPPNNPISFTVDNGWVTADGAPPVDDILPTVTGTSPASGATGVGITATVRATFSEAIKSGTLVFSVGGVSGTTTYTGTTATFTPGANLAYSRKYTASVSASDLAGNPMAAAYSWSFTTRARPTGGGGGGGGGGGFGGHRLPPGTTDVRGEISWEGVFEEPVTAASEDELCSLTIPEGTVGLTSELERLTEITIAEMDEPPSPPEDAHVIGLAYDLGPDGATFDPAITLTFSYDPADIPEGIAEGDLVLAFYDEATGEWIELEGCVVDPVNNTITASISHFTTFAIVGAPPPPPVAPAAFSVSDLTVKPVQVKPKEAVTITVSVANTGGSEGSYTVVLNINDVKEAEKRVVVAAGKSQDVSFTVSKEEAASYSVAVDGLSASFTVVAPPAPVPAPPAPPAPAPTPAPEVVPVNWPVIGGVIGGVIVVGLLVFFLVRRRAV